MLCPKCGKDVPEGIAFCPYCGVPLSKAMPAVKTATERGESSPTPSSRSKKPLIIGVVCAIVALALALGGFLFWKADTDAKAQQEDERVHSIHAVSFTVNAPSYTSAATRIPVQVKGINVDGADVDETQFVDGSGRGIGLTQGTYELSFPASPLLEDGSLFEDNQTVVKVTVGENLQKEESVQFEEATVDFKVAEPLTITDEQIARAHDYAKRDIAQDPEGAKADSLMTFAIGKRDQAVADKKAADEAEKAAAEAEAAAKKAACHFDAGAFYLDVPESWYNRWTTTETGEDRRPSNGGAMLGGKNLYYTFYLDGTEMFVVAKYFFNIGGPSSMSQYWVDNSSQIFMPSNACSSEDASYVRDSLVFTGINPNEGTK